MMYLESPILLVQLSILFYLVLKYKNLLEIEIVLCSMLVYLTMVMFMVEILPKIILEYVIVSGFFPYEMF